MSIVQFYPVLPFYFRGEPVSGKEKRELIEELKQLTELLKRNPSYTRTRLDSVLAANWFWWKVIFWVLSIPVVLFILLIILSICVPIEK